MILFSGRKAQLGDTIIFIGLIIIFVAFGAILPFIQNDFSVSFANDNSGSLIPDSNPADDINPLTASFSWLGVFFSVAKMFLWSFGQLPLWAELIVEIFRIILYVLGFRMIRGI